MLRKSSPPIWKPGALARRPAENSADAADVVRRGAELLPHAGKKKRLRVRRSCLPYLPPVISCKNILGRELAWVSMFVLTWERT